MARPGYPSPNALGLPSQFTSWRPDQETAVDLLLNPPSRVVGVTAPTGSGKSLMYMTAAHLWPGRTAVLTANKPLQDQLGADFARLDPVDVRGQNAYPCRALLDDGEWAHLTTPEMHLGDKTCDKGPCHAGLSCSLREIGCDAYDRLRAGQKGRLVITNYALWLAQKRYGQGLGAIDQVVLDEAHQAPDELSGALTLELPRWLIGVLGMSDPKAGSDLGAWADWAKFWLTKIRRQLDAPVNAHPKDLKRRRWLKEAESVLQGMTTMTAGVWIEDSTPDVYRFEILWPGQYAEPLLFQGAGTIVLLSATLTSKTLQLLGVPAGMSTLWECPSRFPVDRRPVIYVPTVRVDNRMGPAHVAMLVARIDQILDQRPGVKGIIHAVSYQRAAQIYALSRHKDRIRLHAKGQSVASVVAAHKASPGADILLSPSVDTGLDFPYAQCRLQIIVKLPFPSSQSAVTQARAAADPEYVPYLMTQRLQQSVGRGMRAADDWCETIILDDNWRWVKGKYSHLMTSSFKAACRQSVTIPPAPKFPGSF